MSKDGFDVFSIAHRETARSALAAAFGSTPVGAITAMTGGATTASVYRVEVGQRRYLLRIEGEPSPLRNPHQYVSMRIATEAGIAPAIRYLDEAARIVVIDFIEHQPLKTYPAGRPHWRRRWESCSRGCRPPRSSPITSTMATSSRACLRMCGGPVCLPPVCLMRMWNVSNCSGKPTTQARLPLVSSHNDPTPNNILFDGERLWLIDWEFACRNDPLVDAAIVLNQFAHSRELEDVLLTAWFGRAPTRRFLPGWRRSARSPAFFMRASCLARSAAASWAKDDTDLSAPTPEQFRLAIDEGRLIRGAVETRHILGKMYLASFLSGVAAPKLEGAGLAAAEIH